MASKLSMNDLYKQKCWERKIYLNLNETYGFPGVVGQFIARGNFRDSGTLYWGN